MTVQILVSRWCGNLKSHPTREGWSNGYIQPEEMPHGKMVVSKHISRAVMRMMDEQCTGWSQGVGKNQDWWVTVLGRQISAQGLEEFSHSWRKWIAPRSSRSRISRHTVRGTQPLGEPIIADSNRRWAFTLEALSRSLQPQLNSSGYTTFRRHSSTWMPQAPCAGSWSHAVLPSSFAPWAYSSYTCVSFQCICLTPRKLCPS